MISVEKREQIRRAYSVENKSMRVIARELHCSRDTISKAIASPEGEPYTLTEPRPQLAILPLERQLKVRDMPSFPQFTEKHLSLLRVCIQLDPRLTDQLLGAVIAQDRRGTRQQ